jgi:hypothetical protein
MPLRGPDAGKHRKKNLVTYLTLLNQQRITIFKIPA